jgi:hypothetical protein
MFNEGARVSFIDYSRFNDWKRHDGEVATIIDVINGESYELDFRVQWDNGETSHVDEENVKLFEELTAVEYNKRCFKNL